MAAMTDPATRRQTLDFLLKWCARSHPGSDDFTLENVVNGRSLCELLFSLFESHFTESFVNQVQEIESDSNESNIKRIGLVRDKVQEFYEVRCKINLAEDSNFLAESGDIVSQDEEAVLKFLFVISTIPTVLNHIAAHTRQEMLAHSPQAVKDLIHSLELEFVDLINGQKSADSNAKLLQEVKKCKGLRQKLNDANGQNAVLSDTVTKLEFELSNARHEIKKYAEESVSKQELALKLEATKQMEERLKASDELGRRVEQDLHDVQMKYEIAETENTKLKNRLSEVEEDLKDLRDEKVALEHKLSLAESKTQELDRKFNLLKETQRSGPGQIEYQTLKDRYNKLLKMNSSLEEKCLSMNSLKQQIENLNANIEHLKQEKRQTEEQFYREQAKARDLKEQLKQAKSMNEEQKTASSSPTLQQDLTSMSSFDESQVDLVEANVRLASLESDKNLLEKELVSLKQSSASEVEHANQNAARAREEKMELELVCETARNELQKARSELAASEDKRKRLDDELSQLRAKLHAYEETIRRSALIITEYTALNADDTSSGLSGGDVLELKAECKRLEEQLRSVRQQADAYRHVATEEQRLIATEFYEQAADQLQRKHLAAPVLLHHKLNGDSSSTDTSLNTSLNASFPSERGDYSSHRHLSDLQHSATASARSTPTNLYQASPSNLSASDSAAPSTGLGGILRTFLGRQRETPTERTPAR